MAKSDAALIKTELSKLGALPINIAESIPEQPENALLPIVVTLSGITRLPFIPRGARIISVLFFSVCKIFN